MAGKIKKYFKQHVLMIWIVVAFLSLSVMFVMAAYPTLQNKAKKVIAVQSNTEIQFSSNYLDKDVVYKTVVINDVEGIPVDVRNYSKSNSTRWYDSDIKYTIRATLTDSDGNIINDDSIIGDDNVLIKRVTASETTILTLNKTTKSDITSNAYDVEGNNAQILIRNSSGITVNNYMVYFPSASSKVCVKLEAIPDSSHRDLYSIGVILAASDKSSIQGDGWSGSFNDPDNVSPSAYDAFNYAITGHGDSTTATIQWNSNVISLNKAYFKSDFNNADPTTATDVASKPGWKTLTIPLVTNHDNGRYSFQVFKTSGFNTFISEQRAAYAEEMNGKTEGDDGWVSEETYLWNKLNSCIIFDDGI